MVSQKSGKMATRTIAYSAMMTAIVAVATLIGMSIGTGYINMGDIAILTTAYMFGPIPAMIAGGLGSFIADLIVYPTTMWFTLVIKAIEGLVAGILLFKVLPNIAKSNKKKIAMYYVLSLVPAIIMIAGYFGTQALIWGGNEDGDTKLTTALIQLPWDCLQMVVAIVVSNLLIFGLKLDRLKFAVPEKVEEKDKEEKVA